MGLARWMLNDWFTAHELDQLDSKLESQARRDQRQDQRIDESRADLERTSLLVKALADLCIERGVLTREQLHDKLLAFEVTRDAHNLARDDERKA